MSTRSRRVHSSTSASIQNETAQGAGVLRQQLETLSSELRNISGASDGNLSSVAESLHAVSGILKEGAQTAAIQDAFRHSHGFALLIDTLRVTSGYYHPTRRSEKEKASLFGLIAAVLTVLGDAFRNHSGNRRFFRKRVEGDGWAALEQAIASIGIGGSETDELSENLLFSLLLEFAMDDVRIRSYFDVSSETLPAGPGPAPIVDGQKPKLDDKGTLQLLRDNVKSCLDGEAFLQRPEIIPTVTGFWKALPRNRSLTDYPVALKVILVLSEVSSISDFNLAALHSTGILTLLLPLAFDRSTPLDSCERESVEQLCGSLMTMGVSSLDNARYLIQNTSDMVSDFLLETLKSTCGPPRIQFDLSLNGFSSVELPTLGRSFPPLAACPGYTFTAWIFIDHYDPNTHTTIFGAFDSSQTCFILAYLEKDTHNFILQTSVTSSRPSVRFKSTIFQEGRWYHIAVVHKRPKTITSSKAALHVNGEFAEQVKCQYPALPPPSNASTDSFASFTSTGTSKLNPVQAFLGTPRDLSTKLGQRLVHSRWSLASAHLFEDVLSDDLLAVHYRLGPQYHGNFQDCLGSFQTYEASTALGIRNELMHPGKDETSEILAAIRERASVIMPESRILLSINPLAVLYYDDARVDESIFVSGLSRNASANLIQLTRNSGTAVVINSAVPAVNEALNQSHGTAILTGSPVVIVPQSLDSAMWCLAGCSGICLHIVERAVTRESIVRAVETVFQVVKGSWRNSEAMERDNGYAILGDLIRGKLGVGSVISPENGQARETLLISADEREKLSFQLLSLVLEFVGYDHDHPENSVIINPLAYRILLVDFDMWRRSALVTQKMYYKQFIVFSVNSKYHHFNSRRLVRMRIVKRFLDALKAEIFTREIVPHFLEAFDTLIRGNLSAEVFRSLALFITYALYKPADFNSATPGPRKNTTSSQAPPSVVAIMRKRTTSAASTQRQSSAPLITKKQLGTKILEMYTAILCENSSTVNLRKFARTVTNKWLLHLLTEDEPEVVILGSKILARLLVIHGASYVTKFSTKTGGFEIMRHRLKRWWDIPTIWPICFCILFGKDIAELDLERPFELYSLIESFASSKVIFADVLPVIISMLKGGLETVLRNQDDPDSPHLDRDFGQETKRDSTAASVGTRTRSMSLTKELEARQSTKPDRERIEGQAIILRTVIRFFGDLHSKSQDFRDFESFSTYVRLLLVALFPIIVSVDAVSPETELNSRDSGLTFEGDDVIIRPLSRVSTMPAPIVRTVSVESQLGATTGNSRAKALRRGSSFILVTAKASEYSPSTARLSQVMSPKKKIVAQKISNVITEDLLELVINVFIDQVMSRKEFPGFGLHLKIPPGFQEHQAYFESYLLRNTISQLGNTVQLERKSLWEPRVLTNMARFTSHMTDAIYEGWFLGGADPLLDFTGGLLEYLQQPDVAKMKSVRLCSQSIITIRGAFFRVALLRLSELDDIQMEESEALAFMNKLLYWQTVVLSSEIGEEEYLKLFCYQLYTKLVDSRTRMRLTAADLWRILLVQKPSETSAVLNHCMSAEQKHLNGGFKKLMELDNETFVDWIDDHRTELDALFFGAMSKAWDEFVNNENTRTEGTAKSRISKRRECLRHWHGEELNKEDITFRHELASGLWMKNIYASEHLKHQRAVQDQQDNFTFLASAYLKMDEDLHKPGAVFDSHSHFKWKLDRTEGRNRMRLRMLSDNVSSEQDYKPKIKSTNASSGAKLSLNTRAAFSNIDSDTGSTPISPAPPHLLTDEASSSKDSGSGMLVEAVKAGISVHGGAGAEEDYELVEDPNGPNDGFEVYEDKNRKVMRSLQRGDQVQHVFNISRIVGLEACECLLILGKEALYLIDNFFQRSDGEIVNVWHAPADERDPYLQMIAGPAASDNKSKKVHREQESRSWKWQDVISISKRRFLLRDVAIEIFFTDGRSYLLTAISPAVRDDLHLKIVTKAPHTTGATTLPNPEDTWRLEALKASEEPPKTLGSKFGNIFNSAGWNPAMRKWAKGEMSNFHYLMLVNTMAGRTFNDLTQYPVFPWVLADYTSEELDLQNPKSFRDLSRPMGAQTSSRRSDFIERYQTFGEMGDQPPFHYGTHYSTAMIVTSYLIRLQPFVQTYLLLQGGNFDHADRMFYSIAKAWKSASQENMSDVRELTPEFFYLPEFLVNSNSYNFGLRQGTGGAIDNVTLPPWAKGDPKIFISKHREALESRHVSKHLHHWIDLIFGSKQRGDAAIEHVNVFHHLSYHGATNIDEIKDEHERMATISIIHNFGQTPHQVFTRPHQPREEVRHKINRLDTAAETLTRLPFPLFESKDRVVSLIYSSRLDRLLCASSFRINMPPHFDKYLEWGFADCSIRFYTTDHKRLVGLFENVHNGQLSSAIFADSRTLITAGMDCVISAWTVSTNSSKVVELQPKSSLFGHRKPVTTLAVSKSVSTILSASADGDVLLWDLNRLELVRKLTHGRHVECAQINDVTGDILLCRGQKVTMFTLNGDFLLDQNICTDHDDFIFSCALYEGLDSEWLENSLVLTGHRKGVVNIWKKAISDAGRFTLQLVKRLDHVDLKSEDGMNISAAITCITPMAQVVYTGDEDGRVYEWDCVQRER